ncbi:LysR family transcriptional regulator [Lactobacillus mulieris]|uniref:LysR family transcriptional regulator n=1 Tax=Lactobacillus mulieris TaxID=2508708 RepID=A0AAW5WZH0_9LACO|nr:LysR family transcriptional regulator [Lactobacillus mulieris]MCZ3622396.1 LysR family transcriptional regulator [Lactobacillus mulieris]MCZ3624051.1 LysR family transcriptional regulator [Lactobacillus mulieris]MCZ3636421.1 LysR family transcriptional regulator [Lactobacillus mulieris]MCZ3690454.1 LysR family transcriptional regulator [Lactobacillus mulieris]MCZ3695941.1 LysR family transcriptional regulator [Lactobacillus mulieris]
MNLQDLKYFHELVNQKSYTKTADSFGVTQPTITAAIKRLETEFGTTFFIRDQSHKSVNVTNIGMQFDEHVKKILKEIEVAQTEINQHLSEDILFGLPPIIGDEYFPKIAGKLLKANILKHLNVQEHGSHELKQMLLDGQINIALLGTMQVANNPDLKLTVLKKFPMEIIVNKNHPLAKKKGVFFKDLENENFIDLTNDFIHSAALRQLKEANQINIKTIYNSPDVTIVKSLIEQGLGISLLTSLSIENNPNLVALPLLDENQPEFILVAAARKNYLFKTQEQKLWDILEKS